VAKSKALEFLQQRALNNIFPGGECTTNLIVANVETLSHDYRCNSHSYYLDGRDLGAMSPWALALLWIRHCRKLERLTLSSVKRKFFAPVSCTE